MAVLTSYSDQTNQLTVLLMSGQISCNIIERMCTYVYLLTIGHRYTHCTPIYLKPLYQELIMCRVSNAV